MKTIVNDALRVGLGQKSKPPKVPRFTYEPHPLGVKPGIDRDRINQLVDELEVEEFARKYGR